MISHGTISTGDELITFYGHNSSNLVSEGDKVTQGQPIAISGGTSEYSDNAYGDHLHFGVQLNGGASPWNGTNIDPLGLFTPEQVAGMTSSACYRGSTYAAGASSMTSGSGTGGTKTVSGSTKSNGSSSTGRMSGTSDNQDAQITISENKNVGTDDNKFEGGVTLRRLTPNKMIGYYDDSLERDSADYDFGDVEGKGSYEPIPDNIKNLMKKATLSTGGINTDGLSYLTIPYIDFNANIRNGHMIVKTELAAEVVEIFYELYCIKYRIDRMDLVDSFLSTNENKVEEAVVEQDKKVEEKKEEEKEKSGNTEESTSTEKTIIEVNKEKVEEKRTVDSATDLAKASADNNNTASLFNKGLHTTGQAIDVNPMINPATTGGTTTQYNASRYVDRSEEAREDWSQEAKSAYIDKDSEVCKIFEKYGWTWGGESGDYGHFEKASTTSESVTEAKSIESTYYDLSYVDEQTFNSYIKTGDKRALYVYTLNTNNEAVIASWSYTTEQGFKISTGKTINYKSALQKYGMPIEYLLAILYQSTDIDFVEGLANLGEKSTYVVTIEDNVTTTKRIETTHTSIDGYENVEIKVDSAGLAKENVLEAKDSKIEKPNVLEEAKTQTEIKQVEIHLQNDSEPEEYINETTAQVPEVTYVNNWYVKYSKNIQNNYGENLSSDANVKKLLTGENINVNGTMTYTPSNSTQVLRDEDLINGEYKEGFSGKVHIYSYKDIEKHTIKYEYKLEKEDISGNASKFIELYNKSSTAVKNNLYIPWLEDTLNQNEKTADLVNVTKYLVYQANHQTYGANKIIYSSLILSEFKPDDFTSASGSAGGSGTLNLTGNDVTEKVWNALKSAGYSDKATAAVMGNIQAESSFTVDIENSIGAYGLCQWLNGRRSGLETYAANTGRQISDLAVQVEFLIGELSESGGCQGCASAQITGEYRDIWLSDSSSLDDATVAFRRGFERCGEDEARDDVRTSAANDYYNMYAGKK